MISNMPYFMQYFQCKIVLFITCHKVKNFQNLVCLTFRTASDFCWKPSLKLSALPAITGFNFACVEFFDEFRNIFVLDGHVQMKRGRSMDPFK